MLIDGNLHNGEDEYQLVYKSLVQSVLTFNIVTWYGNLGVREKKKTQSHSKPGIKDYWYSTATTFTYLS